MLSSRIIKRTSIARTEQTYPFSYTGQSQESSLDYDFAFQPIINMRNKSIYGHEALVRGLMEAQLKPFSIR